MVALTDADRAYELILDKIIRAEMEPGSVIQEPLIMGELALGRTPIREALKRLQIENFVTVSPRRGMFVTPITITDINRIYEVRVELEALSVRLAANRVTPEQMDKMQALLEEEKTYPSKDPNEIVALDRSFHFLTYQASHNEFLINDLRRYYNMSLRIWFYGISALAPIEVGLKDHVDIVGGISSKDPDRAEKAVRRHISDFQKKIKEHLI